MSSEVNSTFSSALPIIVYARPSGQPGGDWQEIDRGPGYFNIQPGWEIGVRIKSIDDRKLVQLVQELRGLALLRYLDLAENRNITNAGLPELASLTQLTILNLSSCSITSTGVVCLKGLSHLERLNLSFCNRLSDACLKTFEAMRALQFIDLQGCVSITTGGIARVRRRNLEIHR